MCCISKLSVQPWHLKSTGHNITSHHATPHHIRNPQQPSAVAADEQSHSNHTRITMSHNAQLDWQRLGGRLCRSPGPTSSSQRRSSGLSSNNTISTFLALGWLALLGLVNQRTNVPHPQATFNVSNARGATDTSAVYGSPDLSAADLRSATRHELLDMSTNSSSGGTGDSMGVAVAAVADIKLQQPQPQLLNPLQPARCEGQFFCAEHLDGKAKKRVKKCIPSRSCAAFTDHVGGKTASEVATPSHVMFPLRTVKATAKVDDAFHVHQLVGPGIVVHGVRVVGNSVNNNNTTTNSSSQQAASA